MTRALLNRRRRALRRQRAVANRRFDRMLSLIAIQSASRNNGHSGATPNAKKVRETAAA